MRGIAQPHRMVLPLSWMARRRLAATAVLALPALLAPALAPAQSATPVGVDAVRTEPMRQTVPVIGRLVARQTGVVAARIEGSVVEIKVEVGDRVEAKQVIAVLDRDRLRWEVRLRQAQVAEAEAAVKTALAEITLKAQDVERLEGLRKSAAFSQARYDDAVQELAKAKSAAAESKASLQRYGANLRLAQIDLRDAEVRAPFPGVVSQRHTEAGSYVNVGEPVVTLINDRRLEIEADVPADRVQGLVAGTPVTFRLRDTKTYRATVRAVVPDENPMTRTRTVRFEPEFGNPPERLADNQSVTLRLPAGAARQVVTVHKDAILNRANKTIVFVINDDQAHLRPVRLGEAVGGRFEVINGLKAGDLVVVRGNERLRPGQKVRLKGKT